MINILDFFLLLFVVRFYLRWDCVRCKRKIKLRFFADKFCFCYYLNKMRTRKCWIKFLVFNHENRRSSKCETKSHLKFPYSHRLSCELFHKLAQLESSAVLYCNELYRNSNHCTTWKNCYTIIKFPIVATNKKNYKNNKNILFPVILENLQSWLPTRKSSRHPPTPSCLRRTSRHYLKSRATWTLWELLAKFLPWLFSLWYLCYPGFF